MRGILILQLWLLRVIRGINMRKVKPIKITYKYVGDESPEKKKEAEKALDEVFDKLFDQAYRNLKEKKRLEKSK